MGLLAREVADVALGLEVISGGPGSPDGPPIPLGDPSGIEAAARGNGGYPGRPPL